MKLRWSCGKQLRYLIRTWKARAAVVEGDPVRKSESRRVAGVEPDAESVPLRTVVAERHLAQLGLDGLRMMQRADFRIARNDAQPERRVRIHVEQYVAGS